MSQIPMKVFMFFEEGQAQPTPWIFRANHRAWHTLEILTGRGLVEFLGELTSAGHLLLPWHQLAWALSSTHREKMGKPPAYSDFLDLLPTGDGEWGWGKFVIMLSELVREAFPADPSEKKVTAPVTSQKKSRSPRAR